ncbi:LacI family DNA-binding transcriptional regulator [Streptomyces sp. M19]
MATIKDVAERAGVAPSTVSYVLTGSRKISEDTRRAVRAAIAELGYHPRASARTLRSARSDVLALAVPRVPGSTARSTAGSPSTSATRPAPTVTTYCWSPTRTGWAGWAGWRAAGSRTRRSSWPSRSRTPHDRHAGAGVSTVLLGRGDDDESLPWVDLDWEAAVALAVRETAAAGHRRIAFLASADHEIDARRGYAMHGLDGARRAARETGARVDVHRSSGDPRVLRRRVRAALTAPGAPVTALLVQHLIPLPHVLAEVAAAGRRIAEDLTVVLVGSLPDDTGGLLLPVSNCPSPRWRGPWRTSPSTPSGPVPVRRRPTPRRRRTPRAPNPPRPPTPRRVRRLLRTFRLL